MVYTWIMFYRDEQILRKEKPHWPTKNKQANPLHRRPPPFCAITDIVISQKAWQAVLFRKPKKQNSSNQLSRASYRPVQSFFKRNTLAGSAIFNKRHRAATSPSEKSLWPNTLRLNEFSDMPTSLAASFCVMFARFNSAQKASRSILCLLIRLSFISSHFLAQIGRKS